jgi:hypothetical protein
MLVSITDALQRPALFGRWFGGDSWPTWRAKGLHDFDDYEEGDGAG